MLHLDRYDWLIAVQMQHSVSASRRRRGDVAISTGTWPRLGLRGTVRPRLGLRGTVRHRLGLRGTVRPSAAPGRLPAAQPSKRMSIAVPWAGSPSARARVVAASRAPASASRS